MPVLSLFLLGCSSAVQDTGVDRDQGNVCMGFEAAPCAEQRWLDLALGFRPWSGDAPTTELDGEDFVSTLDASAGGDVDALEMGWLYLAIDEESWNVQELTDLEAEENQEWDLAIRRNSIRMNSGSSGPGCVEGLSLPGQSLEDVEGADGLLFFEESFYTDDCQLIVDSERHPRTPRLILRDWWEDRGCIAMTETPMLLRPHSGGTLKMVVESYYGQGQDSCDAGEGGASDGGRYRFRWQWLTPAG